MAELYRFELFEVDHHTNRERARRVAQRLEDASLARVDGEQLNRGAVRIQGTFMADSPATAEQYACGTIARVSVALGWTPEIVNVCRDADRQKWYGPRDEWETKWPIT